MDVDWRLLQAEVHGIWKNPKPSKLSNSWRWWLSLFNQSSINLQCNYSEGVWMDSSSHLWISIDTISTRNWGQVEVSLQNLIFQTASRIFHHSWARLSSSYTHSWGPARQVATGTHRFNKKWTPTAIKGSDTSSIFITVEILIYDILFDDFMHITEGSKQIQWHATTQSLSSSLYIDLFKGCHAFSAKHGQVEEHHMCHLCLKTFRWTNLRQFFFGAATSSKNGCTVRQPEDGS